MTAQLLASVLTDPSIGGLPTYVFIIIAAAVLIIGIIVLIAVSKAGTKKAKRKATRIIEETPQPAPDNEESAPEAQDVPVAEIPDVTTTVGENEEVNLSTLPEDSSVGDQKIEEEPKQAQPEPQPVYQQPAPQPEPQPQPVYQQPVYQQPAPQPEPQPQPVYQQPAPQPEPQPEPQPVYQQPAPQPEPQPQPVYQQPAPQPEPQPQPVYQQPVYQQPAPQPEPQPAPAQEAAAAPQPEAVVVAPVKPKRVPPVRKKAEPAAATTPKQPSNVTVLFDLPETGGARGKYVIVKDESNPDRPYKFQLKANNGQILYESENYKSKPQSKSIKAFRNTLQNGTYTIDSEKNGTFRYKLFKPDGVTLYGVGEGYKSKEAAESAVNSVKYFAENSNTLEDTTVNV